jgi:hypothetical protein
MPNVKVQGSKEAQSANDQSFDIKLFVIDLNFEI